MSKKTPAQFVQCKYFRWRLRTRNGVYQADGRGDPQSPGRHSLNVKSHTTALVRLKALDRKMAQVKGIVPKDLDLREEHLLSFVGGVKYYFQHVNRPEIAGGVAKSTAKRYRAIFDNFSQYLETVGISNWQGIDKQVLIDFGKHREKLGRAPKTISQELRVIKQAQKHLIAEGHLTNMDPISLTVRKVCGEPAYCWTDKEVEAILDHCDRQEELSWLYPVLLTLAHTGMRIGEATRLEWSDIDLIRGFISIVDDSGHARRQEAVRRRTKNRHSRSVPLTYALKRALEAMPNRTSGGRVFRGPRGGRLKADTVRNVLVRDVLKPLASKFPNTDANTRGFLDGRLHSFRHYFASKCANNRVPERVTMSWLGHSSSDMIKTYYHLNDAEARRQMNKIDFFKPGSGRSADNSVDPPGGVKTDVGKL